MKVSRPQAYCVTLSLIVSLALCLTARTLAAGAGEAESVRAEAYRANLLTPYEEGIVGRRLAYLYEQRHKPLKDEDALIRLARVMSRLGAALPEQSFEIKIVQGAQPEAVSFPPGRIYITSALLKLSSTDDELAAVVAHEAAHLAGGHLARLIALALSMPAAEQGRFPTRRAIITGQALQFSFPAALDGARLGCEVEADQRAVRWLERAGYRGNSLTLLLDGLSTRLSPQVSEERAALQARIALLRERVLLK